MKKMRLIKLLVPLLVISGIFFTSCTKKENQSAGKAIDLGLSVKWANCNVGALIPEGVGGYYAWGETEEKDEYTDSAYKYYDSNGDIDIDSSISGTQYDVARVKWGGSWRMPTKEEMEELVDKCTWEWTSSNGVSGYLVTGPSGYSIFLPAAGSRYGTNGPLRDCFGDYWSGTLDDSESAYDLHFDGTGRGNYWCCDNYRRWHGLSVRPVAE